MSEPEQARRWPWRALFLGFLSSALFLWLAMRGVDLDAARDALDQIRWPWWALYVAAACGIQLIRLVRWADQLRVLGEARGARALSVGAVGLTAIFLLPARLGELVRPVMIASPRGVSVSQAAATVVSERLIDGLLVGLMLVGTGAWVGHALAGSHEAAVTIQRAGWLVGGAFTLATLAVWAAAFARDAVARVATRLLRRWPNLLQRALSALDRFNAGLSALMQPGLLGRYLALSLLLWACNGLALLLLFESAALGLPMVAAFVLLGATSVGILVPAGPASIGPFHFAVLWALRLFEVDAPMALNLATLFHLGQVVANLIVGALGGLGLRLTGWQAEADSPRDDDGA